MLPREEKIIRERLGREPNEVEKAMLEVMWSEHVSYKSSRKWLKLLPTKNEHVILGPGEDAGVVKFDESTWIVIGIESHNHPSAVEPYGGAATGIGGIVRDILCMGARPIALLDPIRFGPLEKEKNRYLFEYVVKGIADYGNRIGVPTVGGETEFDESLDNYTLVNVVCVGIMKPEHLVHSYVTKPGLKLVLVGNRTGRDGIHGVTFASEELSENAEEEDRSAVQIPDPFTEKLLIEATLEAVYTGKVKALKDLGGGGLTCAASEMAGKKGLGAVIYADRVPLREPGMTPLEVMISESQERMLFAVEPEDVEELAKIFEKYELEWAVVGEIIEEPRFVVYWKGDKVADLPIELLTNVPTIEWPMKEYKLEEDVETPDIALSKAFDLVWSSPNIVAKRWVWEQYDHEVQGRTVVKPGFDAAVLKINGEYGLAITSDGNPSYCYLNPYHGAMGTVAEVVRNLVSVGAKPLALVDNLNFASPERPEVYWSFVETVKGLADAAKAFDLAYVSGNVSFYNEVVDRPVKPTPVVAGIGKVKLKDIPRGPRDGDVIALIGSTRRELGGSELYRVLGIKGGIAPRVNLEEEKGNALAILNLIENDLVTFVHDVSRGGVAVALAELSAWFNVGVKAKFTSSFKSIDFAFSESHGRYIITLPEDKVEEAKEIAKISIVGRVGGDNFALEVNGEKVEKDIEELSRIYWNYMYDLLEL
ncbi:phosphoribosylformylglycinamidine synthase subunit PurL [Pyrococcus abyssi]|uniref:Phosphoribosylformylglycinamidine synthase subunit PurL n=1 Tax=Pyrococcus abyssi (strain GE5 / Orsay) TaxID=272844 RepID=PURL_PYRAB|nr:phosphoribosylformylglycinamidine synthase subunit PurL [Pyrococcus abyssi]Q9UXW6.1 RecName: Full=Phosphoribosylformylglycinamidine synthase subunit PurL; Short=FGAM synthase; AltName: Full=Formylglycinamide ribonucleotide amidotransferase subunit II; Short=FGAR amidotransferase II; Short=FGAR-AT II; AltName: Full=Glutamine amidotransferase PurL; AltName: Full=Phosphoribosylformylglycinamidine synthase subunit II [Pyrococcus abyssi GE5]CAB50647.1 purL phosphoribosylformylglycinamidine synthase